MKWSQEEWLCLLECYRDGQSLKNANENFLAQYPNRSFKAVEQKIKREKNLAPTEFFTQISGKPATEPQQKTENTLEENLEIVKLKAEVKSLKSQLTDAHNEVLNTQNLKSLIHEISGVQFDGEPKWLHNTESKALHGIPTLFLSDLHVDEVVEPSEINHVNIFNREIAIQRLKNTFQRTIDILRGYFTHPQYDGMVLMLGGDLVTGDIHDELAETNDATINETVLLLVDLLIEGITALHRAFGKIYIPCVVGNHGRQHKKPRNKKKVFHNFEWLIYQFLAKHFKDNPDVTFNIPDGPDALFQVYNKTFLLTHGDQFRGGNGIAGIMSPLHLGMHRKQKKYSAIGKPFQVMALGHFHQYIHTNWMIVNGALKGYDEYANNCNFPYEPAQQALWINHPQYGMVFRTPVLCESDNERV